jgi:hypothetical protein
MRVSEIGSATGAIKRPFQTARPMACVRLAQPSQRTMGPRRASLWRSSVGTASRWQSYTRKLPIKNGSPRAQCICSTRKIGINREQKCVPLSAPVGLFPRSTSKIKYIKNGWWRTQSLSNLSLHRNSQLSGKLTGNSSASRSSKAIFCSKRPTITVIYGHIPFAPKQGIFRSHQGSIFWKQARS